MLSIRFTPWPHLLLPSLTAFFLCVIPAQAQAKWPISIFTLVYGNPLLSSAPAFYQVTTDDKNVDPEAASQQEIAHLLSDLSSDQFSVRQQASNRLWQLGPERTALALDRLSRSSDLESSQRALAILHRFRIGLVPTLNPSLARQILSYETGNEAQKAACISRLMMEGHVKSAFALMRSSQSEPVSLNLDEPYQQPETLLQHWIRSGQWQAIEDFHNAPEIVERYPFAVTQYLAATFQLPSQIQQLEKRLQQPAADVTGQPTLAQLLAAPELSELHARYLLAGLYQHQGRYQDAQQVLQPAEVSAPFRFRLASQWADYQLAADLVETIDDHNQRRFVLPEEDIAQKICRALLTGWAGNRSEMLSQMEQVKVGSEQEYTLACALAATADSKSIRRLLESEFYSDPSIQFDFLTDMERWQDAFDAIEFPIHGTQLEQQKWLDARLEPLRQESTEFRRNNDRTLLLNLAKTVRSLGRHELARFILDELITLPSPNEAQPDFVPVQLCRRAVEMGEYAWAARQHALATTFGETAAVSIWFPDHPHASFWFRHLPEWEPECHFQDAKDIESKIVKLQRLIAKIGRLTRTNGLQSWEADRFLDQNEIDSALQRAFQLAHDDPFQSAEANAAAIQLLWDYRRYQTLSELDANLPLPDSGLRHQYLLAAAKWLAGDVTQARRQFWQLYWDNPQAGASLIIATLPPDYDLFQYCPDPSDQIVDEFQLLPSLKPWHWTEQDWSYARDLADSVADPNDSQATGPHSWSNLSDHDLMQLARLHYVLTFWTPDSRNQTASTLRVFGFDRLAAWQTLLFKSHSVWEETEQSMVLAASYMLGFINEPTPELKKLWRSQVIGKALLNYPVFNVSLFANFGLGIQSADMQLALKQDQLDQAMNIAKSIMEVHLYDIDSLHYLTQYLDQHGQSQAADQWFETRYQPLEQIQQTYPASPLLANNLAWLCVQGDRQLETGRQKVMDAIEREPGVSNYPDTLADILWKQGNHQEALRWNQRSRDLAPNRSYYRRQTDKLQIPFQPVTSVAVPTGQ